MTGKKIPINPLRKILLTNGAYRVGTDALKAYHRAVQSYAIKLAILAIENTKLRKKATLSEDDLEMALKHGNGGLNGA